MTKPLPIDASSDVMCPFCNMGDALLAKALETFPRKGQVEVRYRSYQLMPGPPTDSDMNATEILVKAKGTTEPRNRERLDSEVLSFVPWFCGIQRVLRVREARAGRYSLLLDMRINDVATARA